MNDLTHNSDHPEYEPQEEPQGEIVIRMKKKIDVNEQLFLFATPDIPVQVRLSECYLIVFTGDDPCLVIRKQRPRAFKKAHSRPRELRRERRRHYDDED